MKKLLSLLFILLLFTSCEKEVEKPKDNAPKVNEEKNAQPIKPEIVESEVVEPETTDIEEIVLPEADENTVTITIDFPEDFPETPYTEPELVSPEEFEWGEYVPFVRYNDFYYESIKTSDEKNYAILSNLSKTLEEGNKLYSQINEMFLLEYEGTKIETEFSGMEDNGKYDDFLYKSRVVYISPELDFVGRVRLFPDQNSWRSQYDIVSKDGIIKSFYDENLNTNEMTIGGKLRNRGWYYYCDPIYEYNSKLFGSLYSSVGEHWAQRSEGRYLSTPLFFTFEEEQVTDADLTTTRTYTRTYQFFSTEDNSIKYKIILKDMYYTEEDKETSYCAELYPSNSTTQLIVFSKFVYNGGGVSLSHDCYTLNLENEELTYIESYAFEPNISPDGKYLFYVNHNEGEYPVDMKKGIYVKNLENNTTVYFETSGFYNTHGVIEWINQEKLIDFIN